MKPTTILFNEVLNYCFNNFKYAIDQRDANPHLICNDIRISYDGHNRRSIHEHFFKVEFLYRGIDGVKHKNDDISVELYVDTRNDDQYRFDVIKIVTV